MIRLIGIIIVVILVVVMAKNYLMHTYFSGTEGMLHIGKDTVSKESDAKTKENFQILSASNKDSHAEMNMDEMPQETTGRTVTVLLLETDGSGQSGMATITEAGNGKSKVSIVMKGAPYGVSQPAHIHTGFCPKVGEVKYPLNNVVNGKSDTIINATFEQLKKELPLGLNVHKSIAEAKTYTACGNLFSD
jgi:hypothetical protein